MDDDLHRKTLELGLADIRRMVRAEHDAVPSITRAFCVCGKSSGGPVGTPACHVLSILLDLVFSEPVPLTDET